VEQNLLIYALLLTVELSLQTICLALSCFLLFDHNSIKFDITSSFEKSETKVSVEAFLFLFGSDGGDQEARLPYEKRTFERMIAVIRSCLT
jgi:hypothetical protein